VALVRCGRFEHEQNSCTWLQRVIDRLPVGCRYLLFLAAAPVAVWLLALPFLNHVPFVQKSELESEQTYFSTSA